MPRDPITAMWNEACTLLEKAERLHRSFFRRVTSAADKHSSWEPPVDIYETASELSIVVALPGVVPAQIQVDMSDHSIQVRGIRPFASVENAGQIRRLEIPYGVFERRIDLPPGIYKLHRQEFTQGCLFLLLHKIQPDIG